MGFNTTVVILNDGLHEIEKNPEEFSRNLVRAILASYGRKGAVSVPCGHHCNVAAVIEQHHADNAHLIAVGGNTAKDLGCVGPSIGMDDPKVQKQMLRCARLNMESPRAPKKKKKSSI